MYIFVRYESWSTARLIRSMSSSLLITFLSLSLSTYLTETTPTKPTLPRTVQDKVAGYQDEIADYQDVVDQIVDYTLNGPGQNQSYDRLATFTDAFGSRLAGQDTCLLSPLGSSVAEHSV